MIFAANWKMNLNNDDAIKLAEQYVEAGFPVKHKVIILASATAISPVSTILSGCNNIEVYAQDVSKYTGPGNYTGEISASQLKDAGARGCLLGHMERRTNFRESDTDLNLKIKNALTAGLKVILSVGETLAGLDLQQSEALIYSQLVADLKGITELELKDKLIVAFETVATISNTGNQSLENALPVSTIIAKCQFIDSWLNKNYPGITIPVIYGGSISAGNIGELAGNGKFGFNGFLVGKKSLDIVEFKKLLIAV